MRRMTGLALWLSLAAIAACARTVLVTVPPRVDLASFGTLGVVGFASNAGTAIEGKATREFQVRIHAAQPGTRLVELGSRETVLAGIGARQLDVEALRRIGQKHGVDAVFIGELSYTEPQTSVKITDITRLEGGARTTVRGDMSARLVETRSGASVWSSASWATRQIGRVSVSAERGVSGTVQSGDPREDMIPALLGHLTADFRASTERRRAD